MWYIVWKETEFLSLFSLPQVLQVFWCGLQVGPARSCPCTGARLQGPWVTSFKWQQTNLRWIILNSLKTEGTHLKGLKYAAENSNCGFFFVMTEVSVYSKVLPESFKVFVKSFLVINKFAKTNEHTTFRCYKHSHWTIGPLRVCRALEPQSACYWVVPNPTCAVLSSNI